MDRFNPRIVILLSLVCICFSADVSAVLSPKAGGWTDSRDFAADGAPAHALVSHRVGKIELAVANNGTFGIYNHPGASIDWFTGESIPYSCQYPRGSKVEYLFAGTFWIGAIVGRDTLVSVGADGWQPTREMFPDQAPFGEMIYRSIKDPNHANYVGAISEEDYVCVYTDTYTQGIDNDVSGRPHVPLNIEVTQSSYAWSYSYADDFVLFDYKVKNIGTSLLEETYLGIYVDGMVCFDCLASNKFTDDHCGFLHTYSVTQGDCIFEDTIFAAWIADDNGDPDFIYGDGNRHPSPHVTGTRIIRTPSEELDVSFNWWISNPSALLDFGPREKSEVGRRKEKFRDFGTGGLGTPEGDANKYYVMSNREFDYNQVFTTSITENDTLWLYPDQNLAADYADGFDTRYLLSFGPFQISPGQTLPVSFAYVAGDSLHRIPGNRDNIPDNPYLYTDNLDFSGFATNATWASWIYDNPGVDTDGDGYFGEIRTCCTDSSIAYIDTISADPPLYDTFWSLDLCDTFFYTGDGVPDFRGATPPPAPVAWVTSSMNVLHIRFNGQRSETTRDIFSSLIDFEGYRVYLSRDEREDSYFMVASYDREDYNKYVWNENHRPRADYELDGVPMSLEDLQCLYGDSCRDPDFDPNIYTRHSPFVHPDFPDSVFYFVPQDFNASRPGINTPIQKTYGEDQPYPTNLNPDSALADELTDDGYLKYFEYNLTIDNLLSTVPYWVSVTAFDYGSPESGLESLETSVTNSAQIAYASTSEIKSGSTGNAYVYPNPHRSDGDYRSSGLEARTQFDRPVDRTRVINFANIPHRCTIRIFTLDGDLVREIKHDKEISDPSANHSEWDLITRNTQMAVSGLYYWTVETTDGQVQIGKLVIIM